jgi:hypothetical protein
VSRCGGGWDLWAGSYAWVSEAAEPFAAVYIIETECIASFGVLCLETVAII